MAGRPRGLNSGQGRVRRGRGSARRTPTTPHLSSETDVQTSNLLVLLRDSVARQEELHGRAGSLGAPRLFCCSCLALAAALAAAMPSLAGAVAGGRAVALRSASTAPALRGALW